MNRNELRYLRRRECWFCGQRLDRDSCGAIYESCTAEIRKQRRIACLKSYRPRRPRQADQSPPR
jgi:hypothetical protein